jgi:hypothetical protein
VSALESRVLTAFLDRIAESGQVSTTVIQSLSEQLGGAKLPKPEDLVALYAAEGGHTDS